MARTLERVVKDRIKAVLKSRGIYWHCPVQNGMGSPSLDFICCVRGQYVAIEAKAAGKKLTDRQEITKSAIEGVGGHVIVVSGLDDVPILQTRLIAIETAAVLNGYG